MAMWRSRVRPVRSVNLLAQLLSPAIHVRLVGVGGRHGEFFATDAESLVDAASRKGVEQAADVASVERQFFFRLRATSPDYSRFRITRL